MKIKGLTFFQTCAAFPEQYDVFDSRGNLVGYVRLRWGTLVCRYPNAAGEAIYSASVGDGYTGVFESEAQRQNHLTKIADAILSCAGNMSYST